MLGGLSERLRIACHALIVGRVTRYLRCRLGSVARRPLWGGMSEETRAPVAVERFFQVLEARDAQALAPILTADAEVVVPMNESGQARPAHRRYSGRDAVIDWYVGAIRRIGSPLVFKEREVTISASGDRVFVETVGDMYTAQGATYRNLYVFRFDLHGARIVAIREYNNPITTALAFQRPIGASPS